MKNILIIFLFMALGCHIDASTKRKKDMKYKLPNYINNKDFILQNNWRAIASFDIEDYRYLRKKELFDFFLYEENHEYRFKEGEGCIIWDSGPHGDYILKNCKCIFSKDTLRITGKSFSDIDEKRIRRYIVVNNVLLMYAFNLDNKTDFGQTCLIEVYAKSKFADSITQILQHDTLFILPYYDSIMKINSIHYEIEK